MRGDGDFFSSRTFRFHFNCSCCAAVPCCEFSFVYTSAEKEHHTRYQKKKISTLPGVCTYVRHPRREAYVLPSSFLLKHGGGTAGSIKSPVCKYNLKKNYIPVNNHGPLSASHNLMYFLFLSERSGRRRPPAKRSALYTPTLAYQVGFRHFGSSRVQVCWMFSSAMLFLLSLFSTWNVVVL